TGPTSRSSSGGSGGCLGTGPMRPPSFGWASRRFTPCLVPATRRGGTPPPRPPPVPRPPSGPPPQLRKWLAANQALRRSILRQLRAGGPQPTGAFEDRAVASWRSSGWTAGRNVDRMLDLLWTQGRILVAGRKGQQRVWDLAERWLPAWAPTRRPPEREVVRLAAQRSLRALGVATARDIERHFTAYRYPGLPTVLASLERSGRIERVRRAADGAERNGPWYVHADDLALLERLESGDWRPRTTLLSPLDKPIIHRERAQRPFWFFFS